MHPLTIRADPGRTVAHAPFIFLKAIGADLKAAGTAPAKGLFLFAAVATEFFFSAASTFGW